MAQAAFKHPHPIAAAATPDPFGAVAAGGPIADLQRTLEQRLLTSEHPLGRVAADAGFAHRVSRLAGPTLLIAAYATIATWWF